ncbi:MAG: gamma-glutamyltransferase family protein [Pseudonocardia sp.]
MAPRTHERRGPQGAVSSTHHLATTTAMAVLARGGNAFDAAVAAGFVLQVVEPHMCGPGGEVPILFATAADPAPRVLCGQGPAPAAATIERMRAEGVAAVPGTGLLAATVPGAWDGWLVLLRDHGSWDLADVLAPALGYAAGGFPLVPQVVAALEAVAGHFRAHWPSSAATWLPGGEVPSARHTLPALAATWERLLDAARGATREQRIDGARDAWYRGFVAEEIGTFCTRAVRDDTGAEHAGLLTAEDLAGWSASYETPVVVDAGGGWALAKPGPWSQGPVLAQSVQLVGELGVDAYADGIATADTVHRVVEAAKLAFADREAWYGDSAPVPMAELLDPAYAARRRALIVEDASWELRPGAPGGRAPRLPAAATATPAPARERHVREDLLPTRAVRAAGDDGIGAAGLGEPTATTSPTPARERHVQEDLLPTRAVRAAGNCDTSGEPPPEPDGRHRGDTVHLDVVDAAGNMVSATPSGGWLMSSPTIPALGFCLGTRAQMFWLEPGLASSLAPGRRPRTTLSPTLALRDGEPWLAFGTPGGDQQDQWQLCFWLAHTAGGLDLQAAIDSPAWHTTSFPSSFAPRRWEPGGVVVESRLGAETLAALRRRGHAVTGAGPWALGRMCVVGRGDGLLRAAADRRSGTGAAAAW